MTNPEDPVSAYFDAINAEDWDALAGLWEPDAELYPAGGRPRHGREAIGAYYPRLLSGWTAHTDQPVAGLLKASLVKPVIATIEKSLIVKKLGALADTDRNAVHHLLHVILG